MGKKKQKYDRRRAIDCKLLKKSSTHKGYCKYMVTICELDGTCHKEPAYGIDMQDALSRLINKERTIKVERKINNGTTKLLLLLIQKSPQMHKKDIWVNYMILLEVQANPLLLAKGAQTNHYLFFFLL